MKTSKWCCFLSWSSSSGPEVPHLPSCLGHWPLLNPSFSSASNPSANDLSSSTKIHPKLVYFFPSPPHRISPTHHHHFLPGLVQQPLNGSPWFHSCSPKWFLKHIPHTEKDTNHGNSLINYHKVITTVATSTQIVKCNIIGPLHGVPVIPPLLCLIGNHTSDFWHYRWVLLTYKKSYAMCFVFGIFCSISCLWNSSASLPSLATCCFSSLCGIPLYDYISICRWIFERFSNFV